MDTSAARRGLVEAAFVVVGILIAFSIDAWWDDRQEARVHQAALESLATEVGRNQALLASDLSSTRRHLARIDEFLRATPEELRQLPPDSVVAFFSAFSIPLTFDPETAVAAMIMDRPALDEEALGLQAVTGRWLRRISDGEEQATALWSLGRDIWPALAHGGLPHATDGLDFMSRMNARVGPEGLAQLRTDDDLTAAVTVKGQMQQNYARELEGHAALLDTLASVVAEAR